MVCNSSYFPCVHVYMCETVCECDIFTAFVCCSALLSIGQSTQTCLCNLNVALTYIFLCVCIAQAHVLHRMEHPHTLCALAMCVLGKKLFMYIVYRTGNVKSKTC